MWARHNTWSAAWARVASVCLNLPRTFNRGSAPARLQLQLSSSSTPAQLQLQHNSSSRSAQLQLNPSSAQLQLNSSSSTTPLSTRAQLRPTSSFSSTPASAQLQLQLSSAPAPLQLSSSSTATFGGGHCGAQAAECHSAQGPQRGRWGPLPRGGPGPRSSGPRSAYSHRSTLTFPSLVPGFNSLKRAELLCILT